MPRPADSVIRDQFDVGDDDGSLMDSNLKRSFGLPDPDEGESDHLRWLVTALADKGRSETE